MAGRRRGRRAVLAHSQRVLRTRSAGDGAQATRGADARTLYLQEASCQRVDAGGDALVIGTQRAGEPLRRLRFPLQRVARVVSSTAVDWSGAALQLCMQRRLSICWLGGHGEVLGSLHSHRGESAPFAATLDLLLETPDGHARYQHWLKSRRMQVQLQWGRADGPPIPPRQWEATKRSWVYQAQLSAHLPSALQGLVAAGVAQQLLAHGLVPVQLGPGGEPVQLAHDLTWLLWAEMNLCCGPLADQTAVGPETVLLFERWQARNASALLLHLLSLQRLAAKELLG